MSTILRKLAIAAIASQKHIPTKSLKKQSIAENYAKDVFNIKIMQDYLPNKIYQKLLMTIRNGTTIDASIADYVANAMKAWAVNKGATHYTHWFQPLTGSTAENMILLSNRIMKVE